MCDNKWRIVAIRGLHQAAKLLKLVKWRVKAIRAEQAREAAGERRSAAGGLPIDPIVAQVKTISVNVTEVINDQQHYKLADLLARFVNVDTVEVHLHGFGFAHLRRRGLGSLACAALAKHKKVVSFALSCNPDRAVYITEQLLGS